MLKVTKTSDGEILLLETKEVQRIYQTQGSGLVNVVLTGGIRYEVNESIAAIFASCGPREVLSVTFDSDGTLALIPYHTIKTVNEYPTNKSLINFNLLAPVVVSESIATLAAQVAPTVPPSVYDADWFAAGTTDAPLNITDNKYTLGKIGIGVLSTNPDFWLQVDTGDVKFADIDVDNIPYQYYMSGLQANMFEFNMIGPGRSFGMVKSADTEYYTEKTLNVDSTAFGGSGNLNAFHQLRAHSELGDYDVQFNFNDNAEIGLTSFILSSTINAEHRVSPIQVYSSVQNPTDNRYSTNQLTETYYRAGFYDGMIGTDNYSKIDSNYNESYFSDYIYGINSYQRLFYQNAILAVEGPTGIASTFKANPYGTSGLNVTDGGITSAYLNADLTSGISLGVEETSSAYFKVLYNLGDGSAGFLLNGVREYADNAAALSANVPINGIYHTAGVLKIVL